MEVWEARRIDRVLEAGRTHPLVVECAGPEPEGANRRLFVVKAMALPEVRETGLFCEVVGSLLARRVGVDAPEPVLVRLSPAFVDATSGMIRSHEGLAARGARLLPGLGAGCEFLSPGFSTIVPGTFLSAFELVEAAHIYAFDLLVQNVDRSFAGDRRPNCGFFANRLIAFDFEMCFSFIYSIANQHEPWEVSRHGLNKPHIFYRQVRDAVQDGRIDFAEFVGQVKALDIGSVVAEMQDLPAAWTAFAEKVERHLREVVAHAREFGFELHRSLI